MLLPVKVPFMWYPYMRLVQIPQIPTYSSLQLCALVQLIIVSSCNYTRFKAFLWAQEKLPVCVVYNLLNRNFESTSVGILRRFYFFNTELIDFILWNFILSEFFYKLNDRVFLANLQHKLPIYNLHT